VRDIGRFLIAPSHSSPQQPRVSDDALLRIRPEQHALLIRLVLLGWLAYCTHKDALGEADHSPDGVLQCLAREIRSQRHTFSDDTLFPLHGLPSLPEMATECSRLGGRAKRLILGCFPCAIL
jgi:hypothetical protein